MTKLTEDAKDENAQNATKQKLERDIVKKSDRDGDIHPPTKVVPSTPDLSDEDLDINDPRKNPEAPSSPARSQ